MSATSSIDLSNFLRRHSSSLIDFRRDLHRHPELSYQEFATTDKLVNWLRANGLDPEVLSGGTGVICDIGPAGAGRVALRADIDALAMDDLTASEYTSRVPGVAHACGHDVHTAIVLGAGIALQALDDLQRLPGGVRLIFEPGEETLPGGAVEIIEAGWLKDVDVIFGMHCDPKLDVGQFGLRAGPITSASDTVVVVLRGPGGHTARPERTVDMVRAAGLVATQMPDRFAELAAPLGEAKLVFGSVHSGDAHNVIPGQARLKGTLRTPSHAVAEAAGGLLEQALGEVVAATGAQWHLHHDRGIPAVRNDPVSTEVMRDAAAQACGPGGVLPSEQSWGGDSFAWFTAEIPGTYGRLGTHNPSWDRDRLDLHASTFDVDERAIGIGVQILVNSALGWFARASADS